MNYIHVLKQTNVYSCSEILCKFCLLSYAISETSLPFKPLVFMFKGFSIAFNMLPCISISFNLNFLENINILRTLLGMLSVPYYHVIITFNKRKSSQIATSA